MTATTPATTPTPAPTLRRFGSGKGSQIRPTVADADLQHGSDLEAPVLLTASEVAAPGASTGDHATEGLTDPGGSTGAAPVVKAETATGDAAQNATATATDAPAKQDAGDTDDAVRRGPRVTAGALGKAMAGIEQEDVTAKEVLTEYLTISLDPATKDCLEAAAGYRLIPAYLRSVLGELLAQRPETQSLRKASALAVQKRKAAGTERKVTVHLTLAQYRALEVLANRCKSSCKVVFEGLALIAARIPVEPQDS